MRDLQKDLEKWITDHDIGKRGEWFYMIGEYIERAIKAEAEVERLQKVYAITNESWKKQVEELAKLRKVAEAAKGVCALCPVRDTCVPNDCWVWPIKVALKEGE